MARSQSFPQRECIGLLMERRCTRHPDDRRGAEVLLEPLCAACLYICKMSFLCRSPGSLAKSQYISHISRLYSKTVNRHAILGGNTQLV